MKMFTRIKTFFYYDLHRTVGDNRPSYSFDISCQGAVPEAIVAFLDSESCEDAVRNATTASPEYKGSKNLDDEKYDPGQLAMEKTYYWRIDEVEGQNPQKGNVWPFTTADYLVVDDWESYNDIDPPSPASNTIFAYWMDGWANPNVNGALIGYDPPQPSYVELTVVHGGRQSMPYVYNIDGKYAEASLTLSSPRNWTASDVKTLTIWFHGDLVNDPAPIYVTISNTTGTPVTVTHGA